MGNCWAVLKPSELNAKHEKILQVVKLDGKILEFKAPLLVKDVLVEFSGSGIGLSRSLQKPLPLNHELKLGKVYYILPSVDPAGTSSPESLASTMADTRQTGAGGVKRIKVVITKQELQKLLTKQISVEEVLAGLEKRNGDFVTSPRNWKPKLESISEENE
ncbi:hypothetical protein CCACVL1_05589 [Corchorus capsularis]|uniref:Uncharacterized protein n=1 Tax=Corchorus capsularis TaxID=210143 RepID=A0A1R3JJU4_COCAP|nr:hypothetical protein CCACVL1_05589 [Corchorus capsularis]